MEHIYEKKGVADKNIKPKFYHRFLTSPKKTHFYFIDAHDTPGFKFKKMTGNFHELGGLKYKSLYKQKGWEDRYKLPVTGIEPLLSENEAKKEQEMIKKEIEKVIKKEKIQKAIKKVIPFSQRSKTGSFFGIEAIDCIQTIKDAEWLVKLKNELKLKVQLTYNHQNQLATGCGVWEEKKGKNGHYAESGLSQLGIVVAETLMQGGIIIDVSHLNKQSLLDVCELDVCKIGEKLRVPAIASHSNTLKVFEQGYEQLDLKASNLFAARCLGDEEIKAVLKTGGYVGLTLTPWFLNFESSKEMVEIVSALEKKRSEPTDSARKDESARNPVKNDNELKKQTMELFISHIEHVREIAKGLKIAQNESEEAQRIAQRDSVALASDAELFEDGSRAMPRGYTEKSYKRFFTDLARALEGKGWQKEDIAALFHGNVERVFPKKES